jgi:hypothetical protein
MATWDDVRELALALPDVEEGTAWRKLAFRVRGKFFAGESTHEPGALVLRCDRDEQDFMVAAQPDVYWETPHYAGTGYVLVRVESIERDELAGRLEDSWALATRSRARRGRPAAGAERRPARSRRRPS